MTENLYQQLIKINNRAQNKILQYAEASMHRDNFAAYRRLVMAAFGHGGAKDHIADLLNIELKRNEHSSLMGG